MTMPNLERRLLDHVGGAEYQPVKAKQIARQLGLTQDQVPQLRAAIKRLVEQGRLCYGAGHLVRAPAADREPAMLTGVFQRTAKGDGYVRPRTAGGRRAGREDDVYVPQRFTADAATGDLVCVRLVRRRGPRGRRCGEVVEIVERETHQFVGTYFELAGRGLVQVDGSLFAQSIPVGDPGAKNAQPGDKVVLEMVRFPSHTHSGEGVLLEVLGPRGAPGVDTLAVMREFGLPEHFPDDVLETARLAGELFDETIPDNRRDLTDVPIVTIDPADARDFDDAVSVEPLANGHWLLGVHIADVAHFVPRRSALDREARERGTSVYLPDRVIPMLPEVVSNHLASLQPDRVRFTRSVVIEFTPDGAPVNAEIFRSTIRSRRRFTYEEVDNWLIQPEAWHDKLPPNVPELLRQMRALAQLLRQRRLDAGAIELSLPEIKIDLDTRGEVVGAHLEEHTESHQMIEEFMLAANSAVARHLRERGIPFLRRIHEAPDPRKLRVLTQFVRELGIPCESLESRFEIKRVVDSVRGRPEQHAVNYAVLRSMPKAIYSPVEEGHYALHAEHYCHFTSPIRRYPDMTIHRLLEAVERHRRPATHIDQLVALAEHCSEREQRAESAERELVKIKLLAYLSHRIGSRMPAVITGVEEYGLFAQGTELPAEGLIHVRSLQDDAYSFDRHAHSLTGRRSNHRYRLGDVVEVEIFRVDIDRRELDFRLVQRLSGSDRRTESRAPEPRRRGSPRRAKTPPGKHKKFPRKRPR